MNNRLEECIKTLGQYCKDAHVDSININVDCVNTSSCTFLYYSVDEDGEHTDEGETLL
jgi:hypothetical protein